MFNAWRARHGGEDWILYKALPGVFILKAFVVCLSFANLCFLNHWADFLDRHTGVLRKYLVTWQQLAALTLFSC